MFAIRPLPSPNFDARTGPIRALVLHSGEGTRTSDLGILRDPTRGKRRVSAHYYVCRDGVIFQLVDDDKSAWHAGLPDGGSYRGISDWNSASIGIETEHKTGQDWPVVQKDALTALCTHKIAQYRIRQDLVIAHRWMAPSRKLDPSNWDDRNLSVWIGTLYLPETIRLRITASVANVRQGPAVTFPIALEGKAIMHRGDTLLADKIVEGGTVAGSSKWAHKLDDTGFVHQSAWEAM